MPVVVWFPQLCKSRHNFNVNVYNSTKIIMSTITF